VNVPGKKNIVMAAMIYIAALSLVAASAKRSWFFEIVFNSALSLVAIRFSFCPIKLYI
jgi:hypothetical protein